MKTYEIRSDALRGEHSHDGAPLDAFLSLIKSQDQAIDERMASAWKPQPNHRTGEVHRAAILGAIHV